MTTLSGDSNNNILAGTSTSDSISGGGGNDVILAGSGNDVVSGGSGSDVILAGNGNDVVSGGSGNDIIDGGKGNDVIDGGSGSDLILGGSGNDVIDGGSGNDLLFGGIGNDFIEGGSGNDWIFGGIGNDFIEGGSGNDWIDAGSGNDLVFGGSGNDWIDASTGSDIVSGGSGNDTLFGDQGNDVIDGGSGRDIVDGGSGNDLLFGGAGDDTLIGGAGADQLVGGSGHDHFVFLDASDSPASYGSDRIIDFTQGQDKIDFSELLGQTTDLAWGNQSATKNGAWFLHSSSGASVFADITGDGVADLKVDLKNTCDLNLTANDFLGVGMAPVASDGAAYGDEDTVITGTLKATDPDGGTLKYGVVNGPLHGALVLNADGSFSYTPDANFNGSDGFTYKANDGSSESNIATVALTVNSVNDAPEAQAQSGATSEDATFNGTLMATDVDVEPLPLTYSIVAPVDGVTVNSDGTFSVAPLAADQGLDDGESREVTFQYVANDGKVNSAPASVTVTINGANDASVAQDQSGATDEDTPFNGTLIATDVDDEPLTYSIVAPVEGVTVNADGTFSVAPVAADQGLDTGESRTVTFQYVANDGTVDSAPATVTITINGANDAPVAQAQSGATGEDSAINGTLMATDVDVEPLPLTYGIVAPVDGVIVNSDGTFSVAPLAADQGLDDGESRDVTFQYVANDGTVDSAPATVTVTINGANDAPVAQNLAGFSTDEDTLFNDKLVATDVDVENLSYSIVTPVAGVAVHPSGTFQFDPSGSYDFLGEGASTDVSFQYVANDGTVDSAPATVTINLTGVNDAPVAMPDANPSNVELFGNLLANDTDPDTGETSTLIVTTVAFNGISSDFGDAVFGTYGILVTDAQINGGWGYQLNAAGIQALADGNDVDEVFDYTIADSHGAIDSSTLTIHVTGTSAAPVVTSFTSSAGGNGGNNAPVAVADDANAGTAGTFGNVLANDFDPDTGDSLIVTTVNGDPDFGGSVVFGEFGFVIFDAEGNGSWSYQLNAAGAQALAQGDSVDDVFGYTIADAGGAAASSTLTIHITDASDFIL